MFKWNRSGCPRKPETEVNGGYAARMGKRLTDSEIEEQLSGLEGWALDGNAIRKQYTLGGFPDAVAFVTRLAFDAEAADHHPDILINFKRVTLTFSTHSEGGLTDKDFAGARKVDQLL
jgi:4a-hydroxytetrahydrobiopterin dehydratase